MRVRTTTNHFYAFVKSVLREKETNKSLKKIKCLILDNAAIHKRSDLELLIAPSETGLAFLPPYLPELNVI